MKLKKKKKTINKNLIIVSLVVALILVTTTLLLSMNRYNKLKQETDDFKIAFVKVEKLNPIQAGNFTPTSNATIINKGLTLDMSFDLYTPNDEITYVATIKNISKTTGKIVNVIRQPDYLEDQSSSDKIYPCKLNMNNIVGKVLKKGEEVKLNITVNYQNGNTKSKGINIPYEISILTEIVNWHYLSTII